MPTAIITGASKGIGRAISLTLAKAGYAVALLARSEQELDRLRRDIEGKGGTAYTFPSDIRSSKGIEAAVAQLTQAHGSVGVLVNNAGLGYFKVVEDLTTEKWDQVMEVNARGTFLATRAVVPHMKQQRRGHLINIASDVSRRTFARGSLYCASKYAQDAFASAVRQEVREYGIKVSTIMPGVVRTTFDGNPTDLDKKKTWLDPQDIADAVLYMLQAPANVVIDELMIHPLSQAYS